MVRKILVSLGLLFLICGCFVYKDLDLEVAEECSVKSNYGILTDGSIYKCKGVYGKQCSQDHKTIEEANMHIDKDVAFWKERLNELKKEWKECK